VPNCPSSVRFQEGHLDSAPKQSSKALDDVRRLEELTQERQPKEIDIPEASAKFEPSVFSTEKVRYFDSDEASEAFEDQRLEDDSLRLVKLTHGRQPKEIDIPEGSAKFEPSTLSTEERRNTAAVSTNQVVNPDDFQEVSDTSPDLDQFILGFEKALLAHKDTLPTLPPAPGPEERWEGMVKIGAQKGNSCQDFPTNDDTTQPVHDGAPDLNNIIEEVATPSIGGQEPLSGPRISSKKVLQTVMNPESAKMGAPVYSVGDSEPDKGTQFVVISLCDGMGCAALAMQQADIPISRYCAVELNATARAISSHANPKTDHFPGVDHSLANNINDLTEKDIAAFPRGAIKWFVCGPECADFSKLRLLPPSEAFVQQRKQQARDSGGKYIPYSYPRKGLEGEKGKTFRTCIKIWGWVKKHHPDCIYLFENVVFDDMEADWREVCEALGEPHILDSHDYSATSRRRAWWHNGAFLRNDPEKGMRGTLPVDPQTCMDPGRKVDTYEAKGKTKVRTIGASWGGDPQNPHQQSRRKVWVHDPSFPGQPQDLRVGEAEKLHGLKPGITSAPGMAPLDRLKAIGGGWDIRIATGLFKALQKDHSLPISYAADPQVMVIARGLPDKLTSSHLRAVEDYKSQDTKMLSPSCMAFYMALLQHPDAQRADTVNMVLSGSIIDSGASKHVCKNIEIEDATRSTRLCGFDGTQRWTEGKGYLPLQTSTQAGNAVHIDINDVDQYSGTENNLLSMGKLVVQDEWIIHCSKNETYGILPDGERVNLYFNEENVLCLKHDTRTGQAASRIPGSSSAFLTRYGDVRAGRHEHSSTKSHPQGLCSANPYAALQEELQYDDQGRQIDDGQE
jgi:hypothetical protein